MPHEHDHVIWPGRTGLGKVLGELELLVMEIVWAWPDPPVTVKGVHAAALEQRHLAYTSILSTMSNLVKKGALSVEKDHFAHRFWPTCSRSEFEQQVLSRLLGTLVKDITMPAVTHLVGSLEAEDPALLDALCHEIRRRREGA